MAQTVYIVVRVPSGLYTRGDDITWIDVQPIEYYVDSERAETAAAVKNMSSDKYYYYVESVPAGVPH
jgi:hypothetical protein